MTATAASVMLAALLAAPYIADRFLPQIRGLPWDNGPNFPSAGVEAADSPLGTAPAAPSSSSFRLYEHPDVDQELVAYDPCRPIHYVLRNAGAPDGSEELVHEAIAVASAATGLRFVYDGVTDEAPSENRESFQPDRYGDRWAPVLVAWSSPAEIPGLAGDVIGLGGSTTVSANGAAWVYVSGQVQLDAPEMNRLLQAPGGVEAAKSVVIHELGHVLGLDHVDDPTQLMYADANSITTPQDGDLAGFALLGKGECVPQL